MSILLAPLYWLAYHLWCRWRGHPWPAIATWEKGDLRASYRWCRLCAAVDERDVETFLAVLERDATEVFE